MDNKFIPKFFQEELFSDLSSDKELLSKLVKKANEILEEKTSVWYLNPKMMEQASQEQRWTDTHFMITTAPISIQEEIDKKVLQDTLNSVIKSNNIKSIN